MNGLERNYRNRAEDLKSKKVKIKGVFSSIKKNINLTLILGGVRPRFFIYKKA